MGIMEDYTQLDVNTLGIRAVAFKGRRNRIEHRQAVMDELHARALAEQNDTERLFEQILNLEIKADDEKRCVTINHEQPFRTKQDSRVVFRRAERAQAKLFAALEALPADRQAAYGEYRRQALDLPPVGTQPATMRG